MSEHITSNPPDAAMVLIFDGEYEKAKMLIDDPASGLSASRRDQLNFLYHECTGNQAEALQVLLKSFDRGDGICPNVSSLPWVYDALSKGRYFRHGLHLAQLERTRYHANWETTAQEIRFLALSRKVEDAEALLKKIWGTIPAHRHADFGVLHARLLLLLKQDKQALGKFVQFLQRPKGSRSLYVRAAMLALGLGNLDHAHRFMNLAVQIFGATVWDHLMNADILTKKGAHQAVIGCANQALALINNNADALPDAVRRCYELSVNAHMVLKQFNPALNLLLKRIEYDPTWVRGKVLTVTCCLELKLRDKAEQVLADLVQQAPADPDVLAVQHRFHMAFGESEIAASALHDLIVHHGEHKYIKTVQALVPRNPDQQFLDEIASHVMPAAFAPQWTNHDLRAGASLRHGLVGHIRSVMALILRESRTRFVRYKLGILWAFLDPAAHTALMLLIFTVIGKNSIYGMSVALFIITGLVPYQFFASAFGQMNSAVIGNRDLFMHPRVQVIDVIVARSILETFVAAVVFVLFLLGVLVFEGSLYVGNVLMVLLGFVGLLSCGAGLGLFTASIKIVLPGVATIIQHATKLLFFTSGVFFSPEMFPSKLRDIFMLNPLLHYITMIRSNFTPVLGYDNIDFLYAFVWALGMLTLGFVFERTFRFKLLSQ